ncbi:antibiotic transporter [Pseudomonas aeruginosa]|nr:antibiotic transporter [Pseudomonas aeruginosa]
MDMFGVAVLIFLVTDPFGNIAVFLAALKGVAPGRRLRVAFRELAFALGLLLLFLTLGEHILSGLGLSREATGIAGGIILFVIAMRLIFPSPQGCSAKCPTASRCWYPWPPRRWPGPRRWRC